VEPLRRHYFTIEVLCAVVLCLFSAFPSRALSYAYLTSSDGEESHCILFLCMFFASYLVLEKFVLGIEIVFDEPDVRFIKKTVE